ncbi:MAG: hypothetical protein FD126_2794 [Elusimicrobia bacterium]|nr:MAG: hypothetical protein FD126_2794 [Elusimicrobiota bacterium]
MCFAPFKAKPKPAGGGGGAAVFPCVVVDFDGFRIVGPLVIKPDALWFFMKECGKLDDGRAGTMVGDAMGGVVGGLVGDMINAAVDSANEAPRFRPERLEYRTVSKIAAEFDAAMDAAPDIPSCRECFLFEKKDLTEVSISGWTGTLKLKTKWIELEASGVDPKEKASAYLKLRGYPFKG